MIILPVRITNSFRSETNARRSSPAKEPFALKYSKTVKQLCPSFMQSISKLWTSCYSLRNPNNLAHVRPNQTTFGSNSLVSIGPKIWNSLANELKSEENLKNFKRLIKKWERFSCRCSTCQCPPVYSKSISQNTAPVSFEI